MSMPMTLATIDPALISLETSLAATTLQELVPNVDLIRMMMQKVFNLPRNRNTHPTNRLIRFEQVHRGRESIRMEPHLSEHLELH